MEATAGARQAQGGRNAGESPSDGTPPAAGLPSHDRHTTATRPPHDRHTTALAIVRQYDTMYHKDRQTATMLRNQHLAKSISDAGWAAFLSVLSVLSTKAACAGRSVVTLPPASTSQRCSGGGRVVWKGVSVRWHHST